MRSPAGQRPADRERLAEFGGAIGLAFQLADDLLDLSADAKAIGKTTGKDAAAGKATLVALHGADWAKRQLFGLVGQAQALLEPYGERAALASRSCGFHRRTQALNHPNPHMTLRSARLNGILM